MTNNDLDSIDKKIEQLKKEREQIRLDSKEARWQEIVDQTQKLEELIEKYLVDYEGKTPYQEPKSLKDYINMGMNLYGQYETVKSVMDVVGAIGFGGVNT